MRPKQLERMIRLIGALHAKEPRTADEIAATLGVSRRTIFRDLKILQESGISYDYDQTQNKFALRKEYFLPPVGFSLTEALVLLTMVHSFASPEVLPHPDIAEQVRRKIESLLPDVSENGEGVLENIKIRMPPTSDSSSLSDLWQKISRAMNTEHKMRCQYDSYFEGQEINTMLQPYRLMFMSRGWYLIAYSEMHESVRTFKLERMLDLRETIDSYLTPKDFTLDDYFGNAWQMIRGEETYEVRIRFLPRVADNVNEVWWHRTQETEWVEDGSLRFSVTVDGLDEISWWILGYGDHAIVESPPELKAMIYQRARNMVASYESAATVE